MSVLRQGRVRSCAATLTREITSMASPHCPPATHARALLPSHCRIGSGAIEVALVLCGAHHLVREFILLRNAGLERAHIAAAECAHAARALGMPQPSTKHRLAESLSPSAEDRGCRCLMFGACLRAPHSCDQILGGWHAPAGLGRAGNTARPRVSSAAGGDCDDCRNMHRMRSVRSFG